MKSKLPANLFGIIAVVVIVIVYFYGLILTRPSADAVDKLTKGQTAESVSPTFLDDGPVHKLLTERELKVSLPLILDQQAPKDNPFNNLE